MAIARKCNKCHKCFDPFDMDGKMCTFENPTFRTSMDIKEHFHGEFLDESEGADGVIDLCPDCAKAFKYFMTVPSAVFDGYKYQSPCNKLRKKNAEEELNNFLRETAKKIAKEPPLDVRLYKDPGGDTDGDHEIFKR